MRGETICKLCYNNHDLACCISKLSLKSDAYLQMDFTDKQVSSRNQSNFYNNIDPYILLEIFQKKNKLVVILIMNHL